MYITKIYHFWRGGKSNFDSRLFSTNKNTETYPRANSNVRNLHLSPFPITPRLPPPPQVKIKGEEVSQQAVKAEMLEKRLENARRDGEIKLDTIKYELGEAKKIISDKDRQVWNLKIISLILFDDR